MFDDIKDDFESDLVFEKPIFSKGIGDFKSNKEIVVIKKDSILDKYEFIKNIFEQKASTLEDEFDEEIFELSKVESEEMLELIMPILERIDEEGLSVKYSEELKRYLHTLKGSVRMSGLNKLGMLAHRLESLLDSILERKINIYLIKDILLKEIDKIVFLVKHPNKRFTQVELYWLDEVEINSSESIKDSDIEKNKDIKVINSIENTIEGTVEKLDVVEKNVGTIESKNKQYIRVASHTIDDIINDAGDIRLTRTTLEGVLQNNRLSMMDLKDSSSKILSMIREIQIQAESQIQTKVSNMDEMGEDFDPLEFDRFTRLQELTRFMNESISDVYDTLNLMEKSIKVQEASMAQQSILTDSVLDSLMKVRLLPIGSLSDRLYKITRNTSKELKKSISLELLGENTEVDRLVLDKITSPIEHLLRNSIAHGIENSIERIAMGKNQVGKIIIEANLDGNFIVLKIKDDGGGINLEKVKEIGVKKGLIDINNNNEEDIVNLIFKSGFSTADSVSQVAGRGVGMDVVKNEISAINGVIKIETKKNIGTTFTLNIPVSFATNQAMLVKTGTKLSGIPTVLIDEVISLKEAVFKSVVEKRIYQHRNENIEVKFLGHLLGTLKENELPDIKAYNALIKISFNDKKIFLHVEEIDKTIEVLVKPMGSILSKINGFLGATLLGDGRQCVLINPLLMDLLNKKTMKSNDVKIHKNVVLVVDDSITVRKATTKVLEKYGYHVIVGKDGSDGLEQLQVMTPNIILSDIEMPKMDGFEFVRNVKNIQAYKNIPIIMITSRTAEKHKTMAYDLGVDGFLGKPYQEDELIETIKKLIDNKEVEK